VTKEAGHREGGGSKVCLWIVEQGDQGLVIDGSWYLMLNLGRVPSAALDILLCQKTPLETEEGFRVLCP